MMRSKPGSSMQKTYDECYLICSTAVYFEGQNNEAEALRSWRSALDQIYYHNAYKLPTNYFPKSETEKALLDSLKKLEVQCKERVDVLEALRRSRKDMAKAEKEATKEIAKDARRSDRGKDRPSDQLTPPESTAEGAWPPVQHLESSKPPALPSRPSLFGRVSAEGLNVFAKPAPLVATSPLLAPPTLPAPPKQLSRTPSPDSKNKKTMRTTLRTSDRKSSRPRTTRTTTQGPAPLRAAGMAWDTGSKPLNPQTFPSPPNLPLYDASIPSRLEATAARKRLDQMGADLGGDQPEKSHFVRPSASADVIPTANWRDMQRAPISPRPGQVDNADSTARRDSGPGLPSASAASRSPLPEQAARFSQTKPTSSGTPLGPSKPPEISYRNEFPPSTLKSFPPSTANAVFSSALRESSEKSRPSSFSRKPMPNVPVSGHNGSSLGPTLVPSSAGQGAGTANERPNNSTATSHQVSAGPIKHRGQAQSPTPSPSSDATSEDRDEVSESDAHEQRKAALLADLPKNVDAATASQILNEIIVHGDEVHWSDVAGLDAAKKALKEAVVYPFLRPDLFMGLREPARGMLLFGPPGTGKTMLARAVATESKSTFFAISAGNLTSKWHGESEKLVRALFAVAKRLAPSIIFVDEIDSLLGSRGGSGGGGEHEASRRSKTEFLIQWSDLQRAAAGSNHGNNKNSDGNKGDPTRVLVLAATNMPWDIDEAARRRFVRRQYIPLPETETREVQFRTLLGHQNHELNDEDISVLVQVTEGFSGSDITALAKDAAMGPLRNLGEALLYTPMDQIRPIIFKDFEASLENIRPSVSKAGLREYEDWAKEYGERGG